MFLAEIYMYTDTHIHTYWLVGCFVTFFMVVVCLVVIIIIVVGFFFLDKNVSIDVYCEVFKLDVF